MHKPTPTEMVNRVSGLIGIDIDELLEELRTASMQYESAKAKVTVAKSHERVLLAELRQNVRDNSEVRVTVAEVEDKAYSSDEYKEFYEQNKTIQLEYAKAAAKYDNLDRMFQTMRSLMSFAKMEGS